MGQKIVEFADNRAPACDFFSGRMIDEDENQCDSLVTEGRVTAIILPFTFVRGCCTLAATSKGEKRR